MKEYKPILVWILILGGLLWGYEGITGTNLLVSILGVSIANIVEIIVGIVALVLAYIKLTMKKGK
jgi:uncharacterized membrane protein YuzA (DUF378 family)